MFNFLNLGFEGYRTIGQADLANARMLSRALEHTGYYTVSAIAIYVFCLCRSSAHPLTRSITHRS